MRFGRILLVCGLTLAALGASNVSSWSLERDGPVKQATHYSAVNDRCLGLLDTGRIADQAGRPALQTNAVARQTALGLMLGVLYAIGPRENAVIRPKASGVDSSRAQAVARYRQCRSQQTLESFASN